MLRCLEVEGLGRGNISKSASLIQRLESLPAQLFIKHRATLRKTHNYNSLRRLVEHQPSMGFVKAIGQRHRRNASRSLDIWAEALT
ncbi:hypothetical protein [Nostoc sp.]|uniref:hypothetical protein n=1 Tax=Nostoc sp. TaxID=1180 RepID=UPI002FF58F0D